MKEWGNRGPVVLVPTMYYNTPVKEFEQAGVSLVIWANHILRSSIKAMQETAAHIYRERSIAAIESEVVSVKEIFRLQNAKELEEAEKRYLP
jgi:phosphoenolpyruvate phosphomutase